jgi:hypothetical protein
MKLDDALRPYRGQFSKYVLLGAQKRGLSIDAVCEITGVSTARIMKMRDEKAWLTDDQFAAIESATGKSIGQLAILGANIKDKALTKLMNTTAPLRSTVRKSHTSKRA